MTNKPLTLALAAAALLTMAGGRANAAAQVFPTPKGPPLTPPAANFPAPPDCPAHITIGQIFNASHNVPLGMGGIPSTSQLIYNALPTGIGFANNISSSGRASTYQCILGNKLIGPWYFPTSSRTDIPTTSEVIFSPNVEGAEGITFTGEGGEFRPGQSAKAPTYRIQVLPPTFGGTTPAANFTGASSLMAVTGSSFLLGNSLRSTDLKVGVSSLPGGGGTTFDLNVQGALPLPKAVVPEGMFQPGPGFAGCDNSSNSMEAYKPIGAPVPGGAGCGGKFLSTTTGHANTIPFPTIPANQRLNGFWVTNDMALSGDVQVISFSNFWCEIPASEGGCPATIAPPDKNPVVPGLPEPASVSLLLLGLAGLGFERWRSRHGRGGRIRVNEI